MEAETQLNAHVCLHVMLDAEGKLTRAPRCTYPWLSGVCA